MQRYGWFLVRLVWIVLGLAWNPLAWGASWPMRQCDMHHTGRASYSVPAERLNDTFFNAVSWQKPAPGPLSSTSMTFFDGAGPDGTDIVVAGYHWPKGMQGMDRHSGKLFWTGNPGGGETIGTIAPAFSNDGSVIYVVNDATESAEYPQGHPLMAFLTVNGPAGYWHNGADSNPHQLEMASPTIDPDGRIFMHAWVDRPYAGTDNGIAIRTTWQAATSVNCGTSDPSLYLDGKTIKVIIGGRSRTIQAYHGTTGAQLWTSSANGIIEASATINPANGNVYVGCGDDSIYVVGLNKKGEALWGSTSKLVYQYIPGANNPQRADATGCLSQDGTTYYFQTNSSQGDGRLYAIKTADGKVKWSFETHGQGWETKSSCPIVTSNGVVVVGNNLGRTYYAIKDNGTSCTLLDTLVVDSQGNAQASPTLSPDGMLYLPVRTNWIIGNGDGDVPNNQVGNLYTAFDLSANPPQPKLPPPAWQMAVALNHAVALSWVPISDLTGYFDHYAIYRDTSAFTTLAGKTPIAVVSGISSNGYTDTTAENGVHYYYAVTSVTSDGTQFTTVQSIGPRTPYDETDLQVVSISRTPRYPRYYPIYTNYEITEPSGFGPYYSGAATGLGGGQTASTQRWPENGDTVTYTAVVRNRGTNPWVGGLVGRWMVDGQLAGQATQAVSLQSGDLVSFTLAQTWDSQLHEIRFSIEVIDSRLDNNSMVITSKSVAFLSYIDASNYEAFREETRQYPNAASDDLIDWLNRHMVRFNEMFADAGCVKRVHFDVLQVIKDSEPDPAVEQIMFAIFPFRYKVGESSLRHSGYYHSGDDIDYGLLHEMGHQLGLIDLYRLDLSPDRNLVSGIGYSGPECLMLGCSPMISRHSALAMNHWQEVAHGYFGQYMYQMPAEVRLRILDHDGKPLPGATVKVYQKVSRPGSGEIITDQIKAQGVTDQAGEYVLPDIPVDPAKVPPTYAGDELHDNPFGYLSVVGENAVLHFRVEYDGGVDYAWLDVTEVNVAYWQGQTAVATFDRQLALGGQRQDVPPADMAELNAGDWSAWAQGSSTQNTYVEDDTNNMIVGSGSVKFVTDGGFDTYVRYPRTFTALWDLSCARVLRISFYAENPNFSFQGGSPWIRLKDVDNNYFEYQYYQNGNPVDLLNEAYWTWRSYEIPLDAAPDEQNGWRRTTVNTPALSRIQFLEIHADTWGGGFNLWLDGVGFDVPGRSPADFDRDCDVDKADFDALATCFSGAGVRFDSGCSDKNLDHDDDVDQSDFGLFQRCYSGENNPADPRCME